MTKQNNFAYIDGANLYHGVASLGWQLDYARFRVWLTEKYQVKTAYLFLGLIPRYKEVIYDDNGKPKGNCDADLVVQVMRDAWSQAMETFPVWSSS